MKYKNLDLKRIDFMERTKNAVELWAEEFSKKPIRPLTKEEMSGFIGWSIVESSESFNDNELK